MHVLLLRYYWTSSYTTSQNCIQFTLLLLIKLIAMNLTIVAALVLLDNSSSTSVPYVL
jgi:hypothetical protein